MTADVDEHHGRRVVSLDLALEVLERHAEVVAVAVHELNLRTACEQCQRCGHEGVRRAQDGATGKLEERARRERGAGPARERDRFEPVPPAPGRLERLRHRAARPLLAIEDLVPERVQASPVAMVEADGEGVDVHGTRMAAGLVGAAPVLNHIDPERSLTAATTTADRRGTVPMMAESGRRGLSVRNEALSASPPMFDSQLLDRLTRVHPSVPVLIFLPAVAAFGIAGLRDLGVAEALVGVAFGYVVWTLSEYWIHRLLFHFEPERGLGRATALDDPRRSS